MRKLYSLVHPPFRRKCDRGGRSGVGGCRLTKPRQLLGKATWGTSGTPQRLRMRVEKKLESNVCLSFRHKPHTSERERRSRTGIARHHMKSSRRKLIRHIYPLPNSRIDNARIIFIDCTKGATPQCWLHLTAMNIRLGMTKRSWGVCPESLDFTPLGHFVRRRRLCLHLDLFSNDHH